MILADEFPVESASPDDRAIIAFAICHEIRQAVGAGGHARLHEKDLEIHNGDRL